MCSHWKFVKGSARPLDRGGSVCIFGVGGLFAGGVGGGYHDCERVFTFVICYSTSCLTSFVECVLWVACVVVVAIEERFIVLKSNHFL